MLHLLPQNEPRDRVHILSSTVSTSAKDKIFFLNRRIGKKGFVAQTESSVGHVAREKWTAWVTQLGRKEMIEEANYVKIYTPADGPDKSVANCCAFMLTKKWWQNRWVVINDKKREKCYHIRRECKVWRAWNWGHSSLFSGQIAGCLKAKKKKKVMKGAPSKKWNYIISIFLSLQVTVSPLFLIKFSTNSRFSFLSSLLFRFSQTRSLPCC